MNPKNYESRMVFWLDFGWFGSQRLDAHKGGGSADLSWQFWSNFDRSPRHLGGLGVPSKSLGGG